MHRKRGHVGRMLLLLISYLPLIEYKNILKSNKIKEEYIREWCFEIKRLNV